MKKIFSKAKAVVPVRAVHLDLKGVPPAPKRLVQLLKVFKVAGYNAVLVEWEDSFPWTVDTRFRSEAHYTPAQLKAFFAAAKRLEIEIIPLVQCLGHMETPLSLPAYRHLREVPSQSDVLNPLAPGARELVEKMVDDVLAGSPKPKWFHLGGDEAWSFGSHPDTKAYIARHGKGALYLQLVEPILDKLNAAGIRPILWHDMMREWDTAALRKIAAKADLCVWGYRGDPVREKENHFVTKAIVDKFRKCGITMWGGTAYKGADGHNIDVPDFKAREINALAWARVAAEYGMTGVIATAWSRYSTHDLQCEPIDGALDSLVNVGLILHDGKAPKGGADFCKEVLETIGEKERFRNCYKALAALSRRRKHCWAAAVQLRETITMARIDARRRSSGLMIRRLKGLRDALASVEASAVDTAKALKGLIDPLWIDRYIAERVKPLRDELIQLKPHVKLLDPEGYRASRG